MIYQSINQSNKSTLSQNSYFFLPTEKVKFHKRDQHKEEMGLSGGVLEKKNSLEFVRTGIG